MASRYARFRSRSADDLAAHAALRQSSRAISAVVLALTLSAAPAGSVYASGTLTVGMTAGDIPVTTGNPDQGFEGYRFVGYNLYDALLLWDLSRSDKPSEPKPGLATSYEIDPTNQKHWIVHLRPGVAWHDGCKFTADDVVWISKCGWIRTRRTFRLSNLLIRGHSSATSRR